MTVWIVVALMTAATLAIVLVPLLRARRAAVAGRAAYDLRVYRAQLKEIDRDLERGLLGEAEARAARLEIERRMLAAADAGDGAPAGGTQLESRVRAAAAIALAAALPFGAVMLYLALGTPGAPDLPLAARQTEQPADPAMAAVAEMVERLALRLEETPDDAEGWARLGRSYLVLGRYAESVSAYERAMKLTGDRPDLAGEYGESLVLLHDGQVSAVARQAFETALAGDPGEPRSRYYLALGAAQAGDLQAALDGWVALAKDAPPDAPWLAAVRARIDDVAGQLGVDVATLAPAPAPAPSSDADQAQMIRGMVDGLAARLAANPRDLDGWLMLARSYRVLGEPDKAQGALQSASAAFADDAAQERIRAAAAELGLAPPGAAAAAEPAPTAVPGDQAQMIRGMVEGLAARLAADPQDLDGWLKLARSYRVLGETEKAQAALQSASDAFADDAGRQRIHAAAAELGLTPPASD
ncbi:MAG TPA: c-type cytochrome biogenesis protein CcmI [Dongiaceae bacterium]|nr:c-type cytochrome biogenesis protein CcmI [Dongiaceae bacterium]